MNAPLDKQIEQSFVTAPHFPIYMDYSATTPIDPRVADKMIPYLREQFGNPASRSHMYGWSAEAAVEEARANVAALVGAAPREIIWTSGATESNNLALKGAAHFYKSKGNHMAKALAVRVGISIVLFLCILVAWQLGYIQPTGLPATAR